VLKCNLICSVSFLNVSFKNVSYLHSATKVSIYLLGTVLGHRERIAYRRMCVRSCLDPGTYNSSVNEEQTENAEAE